MVRLTTTSLCVIALAAVLVSPGICQTMEAPRTVAQPYTGYLGNYLQPGLGVPQTGLGTVPVAGEPAMAPGYMGLSPTASSLVTSPWMGQGAGQPAAAGQWTTPAPQWNTTAPQWNTPQTTTGWGMATPAPAQPAASAGWMVQPQLMQPGIAAPQAGWSPVMAAPPVTQGYAQPGLQPYPTYAPTGAPPSAAPSMQPDLGGGWSQAIGAAVPVQPGMPMQPTMGYEPSPWATIAPPQAQPSSPWMPVTPQATEAEPVDTGMGMGVPIYGQPSGLWQPAPTGAIYGQPAMAQPAGLMPFGFSQPQQVPGMGALGQPPANPWTSTAPAVDVNNAWWQANTVPNLRTAPAAPLGLGPVPAGSQ